MEAVGRNQVAWLPPHVLKIFGSQNIVLFLQLIKCFLQELDIILRLLCLCLTLLLSLLQSEIQLFNFGSELLDYRRTLLVLLKQLLIVVCCLDQLLLIGSNSSLFLFDLLHQLFDFALVLGFHLVYACLVLFRVGDDRRWRLGSFPGDLLLLMLGSLPHKSGLLLLSFGFLFVIQFGLLLKELGKVSLWFDTSTAKVLEGVNVGHAHIHTPRICNWSWLLARTSS